MLYSLGLQGNLLIIVIPILADQHFAQERIQQATDTPNKRKPAIPQSSFVPRDKDPYFAKADLEVLWATITDVLKSADMYRHACPTEAHWTARVVSPLLNQVRRLKRYHDEDFEKLESLDL